MIFFLVEVFEIHMNMIEFKDSSKSRKSFVKITKIDMNIYNRFRPIRILVDLPMKSNFHHAVPGTSVPVPVPFIIGHVPIICAHISISLLFNNI